MKPLPGSCRCPPAVPLLRQSADSLPIIYDEGAVRILYGKGSLAACTVTNDTGACLYGILFSANCFFMFYNKETYIEDEVKSPETMLGKNLGDGAYNFSRTYCSNILFLTYLCL